MVCPLLYRHNCYVNQKSREAIKLLIVEDNPAMHRLLRRMLADLAEEITECRDGGEVLDTYTRFQPDWVLMDIEMAEMDGILAARQLIAAFPETKVVTVTHHDDQVLRTQAQQAGACGYILKDDLLELRSLLGGKQWKENSCMFRNIKGGMVLCWGVLLSGRDRSRAAFQMIPVSAC
jgi:CheY-like chemotaxis protein